MSGGGCCSPFGPATGPGSGLISFNGRNTPAAVPAAGDYNADQVTNNSTVSGATVEDALETVESDAQTGIAAAISANANANTRLSSFDGRTANAASDIAPSLAALGALAGSSNGSRIFVLDQNEPYVLDTTNTFTPFSPLIIAATGGGNWFRRSKAYVVGNFTLWAAPFGGGPSGGTGDQKVCGFTPGQLLATAAVVPDIVLDLQGSFPIATASVTDVGVDALGNLWVTGFLNLAFTSIGVQRFALRDCLSTGAPAPVVSLTMVPPIADFCNDTWSAFDKQNNLWVGLPGHGMFGVCALYRFSAQAYESSGAPTPDVVIQIFNPGALAPATSNCEGGISFDGAGNMWIPVGFTDEGATSGGMLMVAASQLNVSNAALVPAVFWEGANFPGGGANNCGGCTFGPTGLLWTTFTTSNKIQAFDPRSPTTGNPAPTITLTCATFNKPGSLVFDTSGNLWVCNFSDNKIYRIPKASLTASGLVVPDIIITATGVLGFCDNITFPSNPNRSGLLASGIPVTP